MNDRPRIVSMATSVPPYRVSQAEAKRAARKIFAALPEIDRLIRIYDRAGVEYRHLAFPISRYLDSRSFGERNRDYIRVAVELGEKAVRDALRQAEIEPRTVDLLVFTTTTGLATPSVDALLAHRLDMSPGVRRIPVFGLGCAGGAAALSIAANHLRSQPRGVAVVVSVELCSLTLILKEVSKVNLVGTALFGDGAAAAVLTGAQGPGGGAEVLASETHLFPGTSHFMGWGFSEQGLKLELSPEVPSFIVESFAQPVRTFLSRNRLTLENVDHYALHPGGQRVLAAYGKGLSLTHDDLAPSREVLRNNGNLSSAAVLFVLDEVWRKRNPRPGDRGLVAALGPGFAAEMLLVGW